MAVLSRITLPPTVAPARPGARGFFRHLARVPFRHVSVNSATSPRHSRFDASGWFQSAATLTFRWPVSLVSIGRPPVLSATHTWAHGEDDSVAARPTSNPQLRREPRR